MAWTGEQISAADQAARTAGKPYLAAQNLLRGLTLAPAWSSSGLWSDSETGQAGNRDDSSYPTRYLANDQLYDYSQASTAANTLTTLYLLFDLAPNNGTTFDKVFDTLFVRVLNGNAMGNLTVSLEIADDEDFTTRNAAPLTQLTGWGGLTAKMIAPELFGNGLIGPQRFADVRYARLVFTTSDVGGFTTIGGKMPQVSEVWLTRRWQLGHNPREPFDNEPRESFTADFVSPYGSVGRDVRFKGRQSFPVRLKPTTSSSSLTGIDELTAIRSWFRDADNGVRPFLWVDEPGGGPGDFDRGHFMYLPEPSLAAQSMGSLSVREVEFTFVELPPFQSTEIG